MFEGLKDTRRLMKSQALAHLNPRRMEAPVPGCQDFPVSRDWQGDIPYWCLQIHVTRGTGRDWIGAIFSSIPLSLHPSSIGWKLARIIAPRCFEVESDNYLRCLVRAKTLTLYHPNLHLSHGQRPQNLCRRLSAKVDFYSLESASREEIDPPRVHGVAGLRVADASIFPDINCGNTNLPSILVGEKLAHMLK